MTSEKNQTENARGIFALNVVLGNTFDRFSSKKGMLEVFDHLNKTKQKELIKIILKQMNPATQLDIIQHTLGSKHYSEWISTFIDKFVEDLKINKDWKCIKPSIEEIKKWDFDSNLGYCSSCEKPKCEEFYIMFKNCDFHMYFFFSYDEKMTNIYNGTIKVKRMELFDNRYETEGMVEQYFDEFCGDEDNLELSYKLLSLGSKELELFINKYPNRS